MKLKIVHKQGNVSFEKDFNKETSFRDIKLYASKIFELEGQVFSLCSKSGKRIDNDDGRLVITMPFLEGSTIFIRVEDSSP